VVDGGAVVVVGAGAMVVGGDVVGGDVVVRGVPPPADVDVGGGAVVVVGAARRIGVVGSAPKVRWFDGEVWKLRTATRPATVATMTMRGRLIGAGPSAGRSGARRVP